MAGDWRAGPGTDLADLLTPFAERLTTLVPAAAAKLRAFVDRRVPHPGEHPGRRAQQHRRALRPEQRALRAFLDPTMSYSSAWFDESEPLRPRPLEEAQLRKIDGILDLAGVRSGTRVLEIGTGWGALAIRAARRGAHVTTVTLSEEQLALARERADAAGARRPGRRAPAGLPRGRGRVRRHRQRRDDRGRRRRYWPAYFATLDRLLAPGGKVAHPGDPHGARAARRHPARSAGSRSTSSPAGSSRPSRRSRTPPRTPRCASPSGATSGRTTPGRCTCGANGSSTSGRTSTTWASTETFRRMWEFYLAYCEAGFRSGYLGVSQLQMARKPAWN